jgi:tRNA (adenine37-N6)-methyltransferase
MTLSASKSMHESFTIHPVGRVVKTKDRPRIQILLDFAEALEGISGFSHVIVLYWFHGNDTYDKRATLKVHPRGNRKNPLTGVFATRSPARPNLIGLSVCSIKAIEGREIIVDEIDALDGTPVIDLKPYIPASDSVAAATVPAWVHGDASGNVADSLLGIEAKPSVGLEAGAEPKELSGENN